MNYVCDLCGMRPLCPQREGYLCSNQHLSRITLVAFWRQMQLYNILLGNSRSSFDSSYSTSHNVLIHFISPVSVKWKNKNSCLGDITEIFFPHLGTWVNSECSWDTPKAKGAWTMERVEQMSPHNSIGGGKVMFVHFLEFAAPLSPSTNSCNVLDSWCILGFHCPPQSNYSRLVQVAVSWLNPSGLVL